MKSQAGFPHGNSVKVVSRCVLNVVGDDWPFADTYAKEVDAHWQDATAANPAYFNGIVHLVSDAQAVGTELHASLVRTNFKSFLYWRSLGFPEAGVIDGFGSALIRASDGKIILVRQRPGNVNSGFAYLPSGFIDDRDVLPDGTIDIGASVEREIEEEIGEAGKSLQREEGIVVVRYGTYLCFAVPFYWPMASEEFAAQVEQHNAISDHPELEAVIPVGQLEDLEGLAMLPYARLLLETLLVAR
ncbi:NUDIX hydrolase [Hyphomicrobium sp.]|jgi:8-oxo-dGTP pyrophosphatase MutT (NUDIX family)|uniref:NUDIX hydrolase n=1 Tax=Hyphomicrobium sp. TaxID=82 RepID=UPI0035628C04